MQFTRLCCVCTTRGGVPRGYTACTHLCSCACIELFSQLNCTLVPLNEMAEAPLTPFNWSEAASNIADAAAVAPFSPPPKGAAFERQLSSSESDGAAATIAVGAPASPPAAVPLQVHYADGIAVTAAAGGLSAVPSDLIASGAPRGAPLVAHTLASTTHGAVQGILTGMRMLDEDGRAGDASESDAHSVAESDAPLPPAADLSSRAVEAEMQKSSPFGQAASLTLQIGRAHV